MTINKLIGAVAIFGIILSGFGGISITAQSSINSCNGYLDNTGKEISNINYVIGYKQGGTKYGKVTKCFIGEDGFKKAVFRQYDSNTGKYSNMRTLTSWLLPYSKNQLNTAKKQTKCFDKQGTEVKKGDQVMYINTSFTDEKGEIDQKKNRDQYYNIRYTVLDCSQNNYIKLNYIKQFQIKYDSKGKLIPVKVKAEYYPAKSFFQASGAIEISLK